jgi:serine/threonine protein kinase/lipoprotein NlpI
MGEVWLADDLRIGREVALKKLRKDHRELRGRFLAEAQIAGQLEHPGVVPVHDLGTDHEGGPFYVMKLVRGGTLRDAIEEYHDPGGLSDVPKRIQWLRLLEVFVDLCRTIGYAHSRGVLHRDLKPSNIVLGSYGETMVIDWGLAKSGDSLDQEIVPSPQRGEGPGEPTDGAMPIEGEGPDRSPGSTDIPSAATPVQVSTRGSLEATSPGALLGTPSYMAPEVAEGHLSEVDRKTDVYLLGGTLYEILTGDPPRRGSSKAEIIELARTAPPKRPRSVNPRISRALEAICLKAMARPRGQRYASAMDLADDVQRYLADEPVSAYPEGPLMRAWRWTKRHRRGLARAAAAMLMLGLAVFAFRLWSHETIRREAGEFRERADGIRFYAASVDPVAEHAPYYDPERGEAAGYAALALASGWGAGLSRLPLSRTERNRFREDVYEVLLLLTQTRLHRSREPDTARELLALTHKWSWLQLPTRSWYRLRSECHTILGQAEEADRLARLANDPATPTTALDHFLQAEQHRIAAARSAYLQVAGGTIGLEEAVAEYKAALAEDPAHYWAHFQLGRCYASMGRQSDAIAALDTCVALRPESPWSYSVRGLALALLGRFREAEGDLDHAIDLDPRFRPARLNRAVAYWLQKKHTDALADLSAVLDAPKGEALVVAAYYRGVISVEQGRLETALDDFSRVIAENPRCLPAYLARAETHFSRGSDELGIADIRALLAAASGGTLDLGAWEASYRTGRFLRLLIPRLKGEARQTAARHALHELRAAVERGGNASELFAELGLTYRTIGRHREAVETYSKGLQLWPGDAELFTLRGWAHLGSEDYDAGSHDFDEALKVDPHNVKARSGLGYIHARLGSVHDALEQASAALRYGVGDYLVLLNVACIYGRLAQTDVDLRAEYEEMALSLLRLATMLWERGAGPRPAQLIGQTLEDFPESMQKRPEFQELIDPM